MLVTRPTSPFKNTRNRSVSPLRAFEMPRFRAAAGALLRHGFQAGYIPSQVQAQRQQNALNLPCSLPEDILFTIFLLCAPTQLPDVNKDDEVGWSWIALTHVCWRWRSLALSKPDLWSNVDFSHPKWATISLQRAKMLPLRIVAEVTDCNIRFIHRTLQLAHRIENIHLRASVEKINPLLQILAHPNPVVQSLIVDIKVPDARTTSYAQTYDPPTFPTSGQPLKSLHYMELRSAPFYLLTSRCTFLTQLHLHNLPLSERPTLRYFLFMIEQLKDLEILTLDRSFPINFEKKDVQSLERRITLPKLRILSLVGSVGDVANILECITLPPSTCLVARIWTVVDLPANVHRLTQSIGSHSWGAAHGLPLETLVLSAHESGPRHIQNTFTPHPDFRQSLRIRAFRADCDRGTAAVDVTIDPEEGGLCDEPYIVSLTAICKALALSQIQTLALQDVDIVTQKTWNSLLRSLSAIRVLHVTGRAPSGLVWAILLNARSHRFDGERLIVPHLGDVYLQGIDCSRGGYMVSRTAPINSHYDFDDSRFLDVLNAGLAERRKFGFCLRSLSLSRCDYVVESSIDDARSVVSHLVSDIRRLSLIKDAEVHEIYAARYYDKWDFQHPDISHFYRLRTLIRMDNDH